MSVCVCVDPTQSKAGEGRKNEKKVGHFFSFFFSHFAGEIALHVLFGQWRIKKSGGEGNEKMMMRERGREKTKRQQNFFSICPFGRTMKRRKR